MACAILVGRKSTLRDIFNPKINRLVQSVLNENTLSESVTPLQNYYYRQYEEVLAPDDSLVGCQIRTVFENFGCEAIEPDSFLNFSGVKFLPP